VLIPSALIIFICADDSMLDDGHEQLPSSTSVKMEMTSKSPANVGESSSSQAGSLAMSPSAQQCVGVIKAEVGHLDKKFVKRFESLLRETAGTSMKDRKQTKKVKASQTKEASKVSKTKKASKVSISKRPASAWMTPTPKEKGWAVTSSRYCQVTDFKDSTNTAVNVCKRLTTKLGTRYNFCPHLGMFGNNKEKPQNQQAWENGPWFGSNAQLSKNKEAQPVEFSIPNIEKRMTNPGTYTEVHQGLQDTKLTLGETAEAFALICAGRCLDTPSNMCKCHDGIIDPMMDKSSTRDDLIMVVDTVAFLFSNLHKTVCSTVPPLGCAYCSSGTLKGPGVTARWFASKSFDPPNFPKKSELAKLKVIYPHCHDPLYKDCSCKKQTCGCEVGFQVDGMKKTGKDKCHLTQLGEAAAWGRRRRKSTRRRRSKLISAVKKFSKKAASSVKKGIAKAASSVKKGVGGALVGGAKKLLRKILKKKFGDPTKKKSLFFSKKERDGAVACFGQLLSGNKMKQVILTNDFKAFVGGLARVFLQKVRFIPKDARLILKGCLVKFIAGKETLWKILSSKEMTHATRIAVPVMIINFAFATKTTIKLGRKMNAYYQPAERMQTFCGKAHHISPVTEWTRGAQAMNEGPLTNAQGREMDVPNYGAAVYTVFMTRAPNMFYEKWSLDRLKLQHWPGTRSFKLTRLWTECLHPVCNTGIGKLVPDCKAEFLGSKAHASRIINEANAAKLKWMDRFRRNNYDVQKLLKGMGIENAASRGSQSMSQRAAYCAEKFKQVNAIQTKKLRRGIGLRGVDNENSRGHREDLSGTHAVPSCTAHFQLSIGRCTTCCCKQGLITSSISSGLVHGPLGSCAMWFSTVDVAVRLFISVWRTVLTIDNYGTRCFGSCAAMSKKEDCEKTNPFTNDRQCSWKDGKCKNILASKKFDRR